MLAGAAPCRAVGVQDKVFLGPDVVVGSPSLAGEAQASGAVPAPSYPPYPTPRGSQEGMALGPSLLSDLVVFHTPSGSLLPLV